MIVSNIKDYCLNCPMFQVEDKKIENEGKETLHILCCTRTVECEEIEKHVVSEFTKAQPQMPVEVEKTVDPEPEVAHVPEPEKKSATKSRKKTK